VLSGEGVPIPTLPSITKLLVKSQVSSASLNIRLACVTPSPLYIDIPEVAAVAVSGEPCVVFNCNILSSTSTVVVLSVVVVPLTIKLPPTVASQGIVILPVVSNLNLLTLSC